jgi:NAD+ synthase
MCRKNRFPGVVLGLSGGIDSALTAAVAVDALGADRVRCVMMPSRYTSQDSLDDAAGVARMLGTQLDSVAIEDAVAAFGSMLSPIFAGRAQRYNGREHPVAHPRRHADGDLQQVRARWC